VRLFAEPIDPRGSRADWFVRIEDAAQQEGPSESLTWALLAERVTHDLKTPLNNMRLILWNLKTQLKSLAPAAAPQLDGFVDSVEIEVNHARRLSTNFMKLLRSEEARLEVLTLHELVAPCADQLQSSMPRDIELRLRSIPGEPLVRGDREQLQSVLENLLSNAVNAMPDGGVVTITTGYSRARFDTGATGFAECALIEVADTGKGITPELLPRVFEPGVTTRPLGSGVGLAVAKRAVTNHGGRIELQSELGIGTVLSIYLPLAPPSPGSLASERSTPLGQIKD
jgi:signal transduction histidine kinase